MNRTPFTHRTLFTRLAGGLLIAGLLCWLASGIFTVEPGQVAILSRFGNVVADDLSAGLHYALPFPIHEVRKVSMTRMNTLLIGADLQKTRWITGDLNVLNATLQVNYRIDNPHDFLFRIEGGPEHLVNCAVSAALSQTLNHFSVDDALTSKKITIENQIKTIAQKILDRHHTGIHLLVTHIPEIYPPQEVASAFREVLDAKSAQLRQINEAKISADLKLSDANTEAFERQKEAEAYAEERLKIAQARSESLLKLLASQHQYALKNKLYLETLANILGRSRKVLVAPEQESHVTIIK